jgi:hypothetical protein
MKKRKIPKGFEATQIEWSIDPFKSATHLLSACPEGWQFFELIRKDTKATITYIRQVQHHETV